MKIALWVRFRVIALVACLASAPLAWGQAASSLRGIVTDPSGAVIAKASVHLIDASTAERIATTDDKGQYAFEGVAPGSYRLRVMVNGFDTFEQSDISFSAGSASTVNVQLRIFAFPRPDKQPAGLTPAQ